MNDNELLIRYCYNGNIEEVKSLLDCGVDLNDADFLHPRYFPLGIAIFERNKDLCLLLSNNMDMERASTSLYNSVLRVIQKNDVAFFKFLVENIIDVDSSYFYHIVNNASLEMFKVFLGNYSHVEVVPVDADDNPADTREKYSLPSFLWRTLEEAMRLNKRDFVEFILLYTGLDLKSKRYEIFKYAKFLEDSGKVKGMSKFIRGVIS
jgi:hypothetical protein